MFLGQCGLLSPVDRTRPRQQIIDSFNPSLLLDLIYAWVCDALPDHDKYKKFRKQLKEASAFRLWNSETDEQRLERRKREIRAMTAGLEIVST